MNYCQKNTATMCLIKSEYTEIKYISFQHVYHLKRICTYLKQIQQMSKKGILIYKYTIFFNLLEEKICFSNQAMHDVFMWCLPIACCSCLLACKYLTSWQPQQHNNSIHCRCRHLQASTHTYTHLVPFLSSCTTFTLPVKCWRFNDGSETSMVRGPVSGGLPHDEASSYCLLSLHISIWFKRQKRWKKPPKTSRFIYWSKIFPSFYLYPSKIMFCSHFHRDSCSLAYADSLLL